MSELLDQINSPDDLSGMGSDRLEELAREIRSFLIRTIAKTGGHLAPNLGVVELTLALYSILDLPRDKVIWDVGHQAYTHKLLTGRKDTMHTLRQYGGLSGFPRREESEYDVFGTGHTSTSLSAAQGLAQARKLLGEDHRIAAVIGDGALTGGMAFEALNHIGDTQADINIILNDNEMSIAPNVGALSQYLTRMRSDPRLKRIRDDLELLLNHLPAIGSRAKSSVSRLKEALKSLLVEGRMFEELGFSYFGPLDGHNIKQLRQTFKNGFEISGPCLFHVLTTKGRGFPPAEENPDHYHGTGPFIVENGKPKKESQSLSYSSVFGKAVADLAEKDRLLVAITAAMPEGTGLSEFARRFPERFFDVGIAEQHAVTFAAGLATCRLHPVVAIYSTFLQRAYDQLVHDICLQKLPVTFALDRGGVVGPDGPTHQGVFDISYLRHIPNMVLMVPRDGTRLVDMLYTAVEHQGPAALRYPRADVPENGVEFDPRKVPIGRAEILREGGDLVYLAIGPMVNSALRASRQLEKLGITAGVVDARFVKPLDEKLILEFAAEGIPIITAEENVLAGGFGSAVLELFEERGWNEYRIARVGLPDRFIEHGNREKLKELYGLNARGLKEKAISVLGIEDH